MTAPLSDDDLESIREEMARQDWQANRDIDWESTDKGGVIFDHYEWEHSALGPWTIADLLAEVDRLRNELAQMTALVSDQERSKSQRIASLVRSATRLVQIEREDARAEVDRLRAVLDGMTDEYRPQQRTESGFILEDSSFAPEDFGRFNTEIWRLIHRRVTEWQEVQP